MGTPIIIVSQKIELTLITTTAGIYGYVTPSDQTQANSAVEAFALYGEATGTEEG